MAVLAAFLFLTQAAIAEPQPAPATPPTEAGRTQTAHNQQPERDPNELICRREHIVGSNIPQRTCMTRRQMDEMAERTGDALRRRSGGSGSGTGMPPR